MASEGSQGYRAKAPARRSACAFSAVRAQCPYMLTVSVMLLCPSSLRDPRDLAAALEREPRERMPEGVEVALPAALADTRDPGALERRIEDMPMNVLDDQVAAVLALEDEPVAAALGVPALEQLRGRRSEVDRARLVALRRRLADPVDVNGARRAAPGSSRSTSRPSKRGELTEASPVATAVLQSASMTGRYASSGQSRASSASV